MIVRRFLLLQLLMLWQGGFLFYALVVVPIGGEVLGSSTDQGFITRRVANWLNIFGVVCVALLFYDACRTHSFATIRRVLAFLTGLLQIALFFLYIAMEEYLNSSLHTITDSKAFYRLHAVYLTLSGAIWLTMLVNTLLMLIAWRNVDANIPGLPSSGEPAS
jgi:hypothetical protein